MDRSRLLALVHAAFENNETATRYNIMVANEEFAAVASGLRWSKRSLDVAREVLVENKPINKAAEAHEMTPQQARVIKDRFLERLRQHRVVKISADEYLRVRTIDVFKPELKKLEKAGLTEGDLLDFLAQNGVQATAPQLAELLGTSQETTHENTHTRKSKRRRR